MWGATYMLIILLPFLMLKNAFKKHPLQNRTNVQIKGGGGQRPFEQCSKKLHFSETMASLSVNVVPDQYASVQADDLKKHNRSSTPYQFQPFQPQDNHMENGQV